MGETAGGPKQLTDIRGESPYFREQDVIQIGLSREKEDSEFFQTETFDRLKIQCMPVDKITREGAPAIGRAARAKLERDEQPRLLDSPGRRRSGCQGDACSRLAQSARPEFRATPADPVPAVIQSEGARPGGYYI
jgi:hypothetical protein